MVFGLFRRSANQSVIARLYGLTVAASRDPALYTRFGVADTFEGRFESLTLHAALVLRALNACPAPGPDLAQDLVDTIFQHFDRTLREMGVGDTTVPKRMKGLAAAFLGRSAAYDEAFRAGGGALREALGRNFLGSGERGLGERGAAGSRRLDAAAGYASAAMEALSRLPAEAYVEGDVRFPDPASFLPEDQT